MALIDVKIPKPKIIEDPEIHSVSSLLSGVRGKLAGFDESFRALTDISTFKPSDYGLNLPDDWGLKIAPSPGGYNFSLVTPDLFDISEAGVLTPEGRLATAGQVQSLIRDRVLD